MLEWQFPKPVTSTFQILSGMIRGRSGTAPSNPSGMRFVPKGIALQAWETPVFLPEVQSSLKGKATGFVKIQNLL